MADRLKNVPVLVHDRTSNVHYKVGEADASRAGDTVVIRFAARKHSYHGRPDALHPPGLWHGPGGSTGREFQIGVPTSDITTKDLMWVDVPSDITLRASEYRGPKAQTGEAFVFSSTALAHPNVRFAAIYVDREYRDETLQRLASLGQTVTASTYRETSAEKVVILAVTHDPMRST